METLRISGIGLTNREAEVLGLAATGSTNRMIAQALGISEQTVKNHLHTVNGKLKTRNRGHAASTVMAKGTIGTRD